MELYFGELLLVYTYLKIRTELRELCDNYEADENRLGAFEKESQGRSMYLLPRKIPDEQDTIGNSINFTVKKRGCNGLDT
jgi:hypothetical protein